MRKLGLGCSEGGNTFTSGDETIIIRRKQEKLTVGNVTVSTRQPTEIALVPNPLYFENETQSRTLQEMLRGYSIDNNPILLIGNQGVGKNKMVDYLLYLLRAEREYVQLHRDTTIQSLTVLPRLERGTLSYEETPLIRAAKLGRVLVLDEADKAPLEVVCLLKGLLGDGEIQLASGERLLSQERVCKELPSSSSELSLESFLQSNKIIPIHPAFKLFVLANRPGVPFLGNNFYRECGDLFSTLVIENPDVASELQLLLASAPQVDKDVLSRLCEAFADLRKFHEEGSLAYPFSAREAVAVAKHLQAYPRFGMTEALENILGFDTLNVITREFIADVFRRHGFAVNKASEVEVILGPDGKPMKITGGTLQRGREGGISKPRTDVGAPKHGKEDDQPHVGGNQWAGGTGGSDTAGLGGRGGPYRLDKGHDIHQVSDEDKAQVSEESKRQAAAMAAEALQKKLDEIKMGHGDYVTFKRYLEGVQMQVSQIQDTLQEVLRRKKERIWLRSQSSGELDDGKLVDGLTGEKLVFKRRGIEGSKTDDALGGEEESRKKIIQFVVDVSGSMMRFNGLDGRLERMLQASLMIMEALPRNPVEGKEMKYSHTASTPEIASLIEYSLAGHSGDSENEIFVDFPSESLDTSEDPPLEEGVARYFNYRRNKREPKKGALTEKDEMAILETMIAHSQFCLSGDNTLGAIETAVDRVAARGGLSGDKDEKLVIVVSDANFRRYGISSNHLKEVMQKDPSVAVHLILIASLRDEAREMTSRLPPGSCHVCFDNAQLPTVIRKILTADMNH